MDLNKFRKQIKIHEGYMLYRYKDTVGLNTVGVGFNLTRKDARDILTRLGANYDAVVEGRVPLTQEQIEALLDLNIEEAIADAKFLVKNFNTLDDVRQRVIADMAFNMGRGTLAQFERDKADLLPDDLDESMYGTLDLVEAGRFVEAAARMKKTKWYRQVGSRGRMLVRMMKYGEDVYGF